MNHDKDIAPQDQSDHETGLEIIRVLKLRRKQDNGRIETTHGDKTPCGLARTLRAIIDPEHEKRAEAYAEMLAAIVPLLAIVDRLHRDTYAPNVSSEWKEQADARAAIAKAITA